MDDSKRKGSKLRNSSLWTDYNLYQTTELRKTLESAIS